MQRALRREGIVSVVLGDQSVFEADQPEARELALILAAVAEPTRSERLRAALVTELMGLSATDLWAMDRRAEAGEGDTWDRWVDRFRRLQRLWYQRGFIQMITALLQETGMEQRLLSLEGGERRVTNLLHLVELLHRAASTEHLGPAALLHWLATQMDPETAKKRAETTQVRLESDEHAVKITTVHKAKGLEYPIVYLPHLHGGLFGEDRHAVELHEDGVPLVDLAADDDAIARASWEHLAEDARLLYVALTRAKHRLVVVWGGFYGHTTSALGYLLHQPPQPLGAPSVESIAAHLKSLDDRAMRADLGALVAASAGSIEVRELDLEGATAPPGVRVAAPTELESAVLTAREVKTPVVQAFRTASFSELSSGADHDRDHDQAAPRLPPSLAPEGRNKPITLRDFPRGPEAGNFFHELLEHLDFVAGDPAPLIEAGLDAHRFDAALAPVVAQSLDEVLATPIDPGSRRRRFHLRDIPHERRLDELEFFLPVASTVASEQVVPKGTQLALSFDEPARVKLGPMTAEALARVFADHPSPALDPSYPERVRGLAFIPLEGFLKGYIDLVTEVDGRFYVVDYKTNHLGDDLSDYGPEALRTAMAEGHYYLQAHLYALAVHRFLRRRDRSYRYRDHFGGILYLFLKGMQPGGGGRGVFFEKPPLGRLAALGELLGGGGA
ncbi:MAG: PD-(D/E)XK nuclease family protein, partial [Myxococcales bacterium]|nr:PD-(D/E)XK nuclease family protein [Myxococcales bacterium]